MSDATYIFIAETRSLREQLEMTETETLPVNACNYTTGTLFELLMIQPHVGGIYSSSPAASLSGKVCNSSRACK
jgi:hypothetical protein